MWRAWSGRWSVSPRAAGHGHRGGGCVGVSSSPRASASPHPGAHLDLADHDIRRGPGLYDLLEEQRVVDRVSHDFAIVGATSVRPQTTRAGLRGEFLRRAQERRRDFTVERVLMLDGRGAPRGGG